MPSRTALITGGGRGLGRAAAEALGRHGFRVVVTHRGGPDAADETLRLLRGRGVDAEQIRLRLDDVEELPRFAQDLRSLLQSAWGVDRFDVLVNNAGVGSFSPFLEVTRQQFDEVFGTNVRGTFFLTQALAPLLNDGGSVVNVSTMLTRHVSPGSAVYSASKAAVEALTRVLAAELGERRIRVNTLAPGSTATDFNGGAMRDDDRLRHFLEQNSVFGRVGEPDEVGDAIAALALTDLRWVTAQRFEASCGAFL
jgi:NAD(P)-dependent dehydrogenase (short-subunit alcohol dehydrogenase family)